VLPWCRGIRPRPLAKRAPGWRLRARPRHCRQRPGARPARIWATPLEGVRRTGTAADADRSTMAGSPFVFVFGAAPWLCSYALPAELGALLCSCAPPAELGTSRRIQRGGGEPAEVGTSRRFQ
jgi:hypothetical protein